MKAGRALASLAVLLLAAADPPRSVRALADFLARSDGATEHTQVAAALDRLRAMKGAAAPAAETLSRLLPHRAKLYAGRDKVLVVQLRAYIVLTLSEIGCPDSMIPALLDTLAHLDERMSAREIGAAARAVRCLGPRGRDFTPYLLEALSLQVGEEEISLERYAPDFPPEEATTAQLEVVRALGAISRPSDAEVLRRLRQIAEAGAGDADGAPDRRVVREAKAVVRRIERGGE